MTENTTGKNSTASAGPSGISRRTIVKGAAWSVPVVAVAVAAPAASASTLGTLEFTQPSYSGTGCGTITNLQVRLTTDGTTPDPAKPITVSLPSEYTFADGSTSYTGTTGSDGTITLPAINVPSAGGSGTFTAVSGSLTAAAPVTATASKGTGQIFNQAQAGGTYRDVPSNAVAVGVAYYLTPDGQLWYGNSLMATGVTSAQGYAAGLADAAGNYVTWVDASGGHVSNQGTVGSNSQPSIPAGSTALAAGYYLAPNGDLWYHLQSSGPIATGVASAFGYSGPSNTGAPTNYASFVTTGGATYTVNQGVVGASSGTLPAGTNAVGPAYFVAPNGDLYYNGGTTPIATGVTSARGYNVSGTNYLTYVNGSGGATIGNGNVNGNYNANVPAGSEALGAGYFLSPNGGLYYTNGATPIATGVTSAQGWHSPNGGNNFAHVMKPAC